MAEQRKFEDPISLPGGRKLVTLRDAADYITSLPKKESDLPEWQTAIEVLMLVSRSGPTMMARIGVMKALNRHVVRVFNPERKAHLKKIIDGTDIQFSESFEVDGKEMFAHACKVRHISDVPRHADDVR